MDSTCRLPTQVAAMSGAAIDVARTACYLADLSAAGKTMDQAASLLRRERADVRKFANEWGIAFVDYKPDVESRTFEWTKEKRGRWILQSGKGLVGEAVSDGSGGYKARMLPDMGWHYGSNAEVAMRRCSADMERHCKALFGVDDVAFFATLPEGLSLLAPRYDADAPKFRAALNS